MLGSRFWDPSAAIRLDLGPLDLATFHRFLRGAMPTALRALLGFLAGHKTDCEVHLLLAAAEVPPLRLSLAGGGRLGWTSWLATRPPNEDAAVVLQLPAPRHRPRHSRPSVAPPPTAPSSSLRDQG